METDHFKREDCRLCNGKNLEIAVSFEPVPVAGAFVREDQLDLEQKLYPIDIWRCNSEDCGHFQLRDVVNPKILFPDDYSYFSGKSKEIREHFAVYAEKIAKKFSLDDKSFVVDVGSNDGTLLDFFKKQGVNKVLGVDPAANLAKYANDKGIETIAAMYDIKLAKKIKSERGPADVVTANHVFAHTDDMIGMAKAVRELMHEKSIFTFEVSYFPDVLDKMLLGSIIHEHLCYHTVKPLAAFLERNDLELINIERTPIQGGSITCTAQVKRGSYKKSPVINDLIKMEEERGMYGSNPVGDFNKRLNKTKLETIDLIDKLAAEEKTIAGFGAARGGTLLNYHFGLGKHMKFIVDDDPDKQNMYSPGHHIKVYPTSKMYSERPDYVAVLAWVHSKPIIKSHRKFLDEGGKFFTFLPEVQVIDKNNVDSYLSS